MIGGDFHRLRWIDFGYFILGIDFPKEMLKLSGGDDDENSLPCPSPVFETV